MTREEFLAEAAQLRAQRPETARHAFGVPEPKGVGPEVCCPLCRGARSLPAESRGTCVTTCPKRVCNLCDGQGVIPDRSHERPSSKGKT